MTANKPKTALHRAPTFSLFLVSHGGISSFVHMCINPHQYDRVVSGSHTYVHRILFPLLSEEDQNVSQTGLRKVEGYQDPDDYVSIETGQCMGIHWHIGPISL